MSASRSTADSALKVSLWPWVYLVALIYFGLHLATSMRYGYFRDALYYLACADHLDFGYVDQPPLFPFIAWIARHTLGTSLPALIFWPALAGAARIVIIAAFARDLGARRFGTTLAAVLAATPAVWWVIDHQFGMNVLDPLFWTGCAWAILRMIQTENPKLWLLFGALAGIGLENKYSIAVFAFALLVGLLFTPQRRLLLTPWLLAGGAVALLIFLPNLLWNVHHHWPFLELQHNIRTTGKDVILPPLAYVGQQVLMMNPLSFPFWFGGLLFLFFSRQVRVFRAFGWAFVATFAVFMVMHGKDYYSAPAYPILLAAGGAATENLLERWKHPRATAILQPICFLWLVSAIVLLLPLVLPVLPLEAFVRYQSHLPFQPAPTERNFVGATLPQYYADELPWQDMVSAVSRVFHSLSPDEQAKTAIFCDNYGEAAAIDFFGPRYGLPKAISGHQNYFLWGPRNFTGEIVILVGQGEDDARQDFTSVEVGATQHNPYALWYETQPILLCRGLKWNLQLGWNRVKYWR